MSEFEDWQDNNPAEYNDQESRDGFRSMNHNTGYNNVNSGQPRARRPRFNTNPRGGYHSNERGFRPEGFGRMENDNRQSSGYGNRNPQYDNSRGGFDSHNNSSRGGYDNQRGYGYGRGGYDSQRRGYNQQHNGYSQRGYDNQRGYGQQRGGYDNNRSGYSQQRNSYNKPQGGYDRRNGQQHGGYSPQRPRTVNYDPNSKYSMKKRIEYKEYLDDPNAPIRLNKFLANAGICSRREADQFIQAGVVKVNGEIVTELGTKVQRTDTVHFHDQLVSLEKKVYVLLNKPKDYVTTSDDPQARKTVMDLVKNCCRERIYPVGRLDRNTTGVLLFTNDGDLASKLTHPKYLKQKIYHVHLDKNASSADLQKIADGITLEDGEVHADAISFASDTDKKQVGIEIHSGKNRIVRRIFEALGYRVLKLDRVMFAGLTKKGLKRGDWRFLTEQEVALLHMAQ